jgi:hypothetical protein
MKSSHVFFAMLAILGCSSALLSIGIADDAAPATFSRHDDLKIAAQKICPVTGEALGEHGTPIKAKIGKEELFLCCEACLSGQVDKSHWATVHANFAKAQAECPVMKHALPKNPKWTIVNGQIIYVCCPPCIKKIEADPQTYLANLDKLYEASRKKEQAAQQGGQTRR